jgi:hypothetical protein
MVEIFHEMDNHASEMNVILVKYAGNLTASYLLWRPFLRRTGSMMMHTVRYMTNIRRMMLNTKAEGNGDATNRFSGQILDD